MPVEVLFRKVREGVERDTKRLQTPWELSSIKGDFVFNATGRAAAAGNGQARAGPSADVSAQFELQFWKSVQDSNRADDIQAYLDKYPNGVFAPLARNRDRRAPGPQPRGHGAGAREGPARHGSCAAGLGRQPPRAATPATSAPARHGRACRDGQRRQEGRDCGRAARGGGCRAARRPPIAAGRRRSAAAAAPPKPKDDQPGREIAPGIREVHVRRRLRLRRGDAGRAAARQGAVHLEVLQVRGRVQGRPQAGHGQVRVGERRPLRGRRSPRTVPNGTGKYQFANGDTYEGEVKAGVVAGRGTYVTQSGDRIEGSFADGARQRDRASTASRAATATRARWSAASSRARAATTRRTATASRRSSSTGGRRARASTTSPTATATRAT